MRSRFIAAVVLLIFLAGGFWEMRRSLSAPKSPNGTPIAAPPAPAPPIATPTIPVNVKRPAVAPAAKKNPPAAPAIVKIAAAPPPAAPLVAPPTLPAARPLPRPIIPPPAPEEPREWKGNDTSISHSGEIVVKSDEQWIHLWAEHHPDEAAPEVDFSRDMVVGVFLGQRPADAFAVNIMAVRTLPDALMVDYMQLDPPPGTFQMNVSAFPYDIKVIPRSALRVKFNRLTAQYQRATAR